MEKVKEVERRIKLNKEMIVKFIFFAFVGLLLPFIEKNNQSLLFVLPLIALCFYLGNVEILGSIVGIFIGSALYSYDTFVTFLIVLTSFFIILIISKFTAMKMKTRLVISSFLTDIVARFFLIYQNNLNIELDHFFYSFFVGLTSYALLYYVSNMLSSKKFYKPYSMVVFSLIIGVYLQLLPNTYLVPFRNILIGILLAFVSYLCGAGVGVFSTTSVLLITVFYTNELSNYIYLIWLSNSIIFAFLENKKIQSLVISIIVSFMIIYGTKQNLESLSVYMETFMPTLLILLFPNNILKRIKKRILTHEDVFIEQEKFYRNLHKKLSKRLDLISESYMELKEKIETRTDIDYEAKGLEYIFKDLCALCPKNDFCHKEKNNKLEKLARENLTRNLTNDERKYIDEHCLKPSNFISESLLQRTYFEANKQQEHEIKKLKEILIENMDGISKLVRVIKNDFEKETGLIYSGIEKHISLLLERKKLDPIFVNYIREDLSQPIIEIGVKDVSKHEVETTIKELLERELQTPLDIIKLTEMTYENYMRVTYVGVNRYFVTYGVAQLSKDEFCCGDSQAYFQYKDEKYFLISDGMGSGYKAKEESKSTIASFQKIIETGVNPKTAIKTINSILKLRHKEDFFSTLDILKIHESNGKASITKTCAPSTFYYHNNMIQEIDSYSLPVGIVDEVEAYDYVFKIEKNDILVMSSDGFKIEREELEKILYEMQKEPAQVIAEKLIQIGNDTVIKDDVTIFVIKIV